MGVKVSCSRCGEDIEIGDIFFEVNATAFEANKDGLWILGLSDKEILREAIEKRPLCQDCWADVVELIAFNSVRGTRVVS